jgi:hypothetical protein
MKLWNASRPRAEAPMPTIGNAEVVTFFLPHEQGIAVSMAVSPSYIQILTDTIAVCH